MRDMSLYQQFPAGISAIYYFGLLQIFQLGGSLSNTYVAADHLLCMLTLIIRISTSFSPFSDGNFLSIKKSASTVSLDLLILTHNPLMTSSSEHTLPPTAKRQENVPFFLDADSQSVRDFRLIYPTYLVGINNVEKKYIFCFV